MTEEPTSTPEPAAAEPAPAPKPTPAAAAKPKKTGGAKASVPFIWGTGRRKRAVARVRIRPGDGKFIINKREMKKYFLLEKDRQAVTTPLDVTDMRKSFDVIVNVRGGGITGQAGAVVLGLARALVKSSDEFQPKLRETNLLRRDPRKVERKKYGQRGARRRFQFSKR